MFLLLEHCKLIYLCTSLTILILKPTPLHLSSAWRWPPRAKMCRESNIYLKNIVQLFGTNTVRIILFSFGRFLSVSHTNITEFIPRGRAFHLRADKTCLGENYCTIRRPATLHPQTSIFKKIHHKNEYSSIMMKCSSALSSSKCLLRNAFAVMLRAERI
jgi:hypothetical protein